MCETPLKTCNRCKESKPTTSFHKCKTTRDKLEPTCKQCRKARIRERYHSDPEYKVKLNAKRMARFKKRTYGVSEAQYNSMLLEQGGGCKICFEPCPTGKRLAVDHCHTTGAVRGLLCAHCNLAIGMLKDSPDLLVRAAAYLRRQNDEENNQPASSLKSI